MIWLIAGGRNFQLTPAGGQALVDLITCYGRPELIISGGAKGIDSEAVKFAIINKIPHRTVKARWEQFGKKAGPMRNEEMARILEKHGDNNSLVILFSGGSGTESMRRIAQREGLIIRELKNEEYVKDISV